MSRCLKSKICMSRSSGKEILNGLTLTVETGRGRGHHGPERLGQVDARPMCWPAATSYEVTEGDVLLDGESILDAGAGRARRQGRVPRLPVSGRNSRRRHHDLPAHRAQCPAQGARRGGIVDAGFHEAGARDRGQARHQPGHAEPRGQCRLLRRREEAQRNPADGAAASRGWPCSTRPIPASTSTRCKIVADGVNRAALARARDGRHHPLSAPARIHRAGRRACAGQGPRREDPAARSWRSSSKPRATRNMPDEAA